MNVLLLAPQPYYIDRGTPIDVDLLVRALSARGDHVDAVVYPEGAERNYANVRFFRPPPSRWTTNVGPSFSFKKLVCDFKLVVTAWRLVRQNAYDVIHAGEESVFFAMFFRLLYRIPYVYDLDSSIAQQMIEKYAFLKPVARVFGWFETRALRHCLAAAPVCNALGDLAREKGAPFVQILHDISQLRDDDFAATGRLREKLQVDGSIMMYVGNLERYQGVDLLLDSFKIARADGIDMDLAIVGGTTAHIQSYQRKADALGIADRTHFVGTWPVEELGSLLAEADMLVAPRITGINTPMKIFPYLHSGRAVLVTDLPTHNQILTQRVAMLAPANPTDFAAAMLRLAKDPELRRRLGSAGRDFINRNHTFPAHQQRVDTLYDHVAHVIASSANAEGYHNKPMTP